MSPNFKQTHDSAAESKPFQHYHHSGICTNIQLWWQWRWWVLQGTPVSSWSNTKAGHSGCTRRLERESWRRCTKRFGISLYNHQPSRRWTWYSPDGKHHNQIDYILVKKRFRSGIKTARTKRFPGADVGSDHDMVMMTFQTRLKNSSNRWEAWSMWPKTRPEEKERRARRSQRL